MRKTGVYENAHAERLNGIIKNNYLYPYGPTNMISLKKLLNRAVLMYNTGKPHQALRKLTPNMYKNTVDNEDNSPSYLPLSTVNHINHKRNKIIHKKVCLLYTSPSPRDRTRSRMPSSA